MISFDLVWIFLNHFSVDSFRPWWPLSDYSILRRNKTSFNHSSSSQTQIRFMETELEVRPQIQSYPPSLNQVSSIFSLFFHTTAHCSPPANQRGEEFSSQAEGDPLDGCLYQVQSTESGSSTSEDHQTAEPCMLHDELQTTLTFSKHIHQTTHEVRIRPRHVMKSVDMYRDVTLFSGISVQVSMLTLIWITLISNIALVRQRHKFTDDEAHSATSANLGRLP